jgi:putative flippase GtrA
MRHDGLPEAARFDPRSMIGSPTKSVQGSCVLKSPTPNQIAVPSGSVGAGATVEKQSRLELLRYFLASLAALAVDTGGLSFCYRVLQLDLVWSATAGFVLGATVIYVLSVFWVFSERKLARSPIIEFLVFVGIGVAGLGVTQLVLWFGVNRLGMVAEVVKLAAAACTFAFNFLVRKFLLFASVRGGRATMGNAG